MGTWRSRLPAQSRDGLAELLERPARGWARGGSRAKAVAFAGMPGRCQKTAHNSQMWATPQVQDELTERARHIETDSRRCKTPKLVTQNQRLTVAKMASVVGTP